VGRGSSAVPGASVVSPNPTSSHGQAAGVLIYKHDKRSLDVPKCLSAALTDDLVPDAYYPGMLRTLKAFVKNETAATAMEYGLIAAGISVAIISVVKGLGTKLNTTFSSISSQLK
jgi:pilus assembly protein Flp/PilA